jgi:hypothetical protein
VARAKQTERAEARRRHRAATAEVLDEGADAESRSVPAGRRGPTPATPAQAPRRPGLLGGFRAAIRPANIGEDLRYLPELITKSKAVWLPSAVVVGVTAFFFLSGSSLTNPGGIAFNVFCFPPPLAISFVAGILAPRASYLAGGLVGLAAGIAFAIYAATVAATVPSTAAVAITPEIRQQYILYSLTISPLTGMAVGAFAAFYRRFLRTANPQAGARKGPRGGAKPTSKTARARR